MSNEWRMRWDAADAAWLQMCLAMDIDPEVAFNRKYPLVWWQQRPWLWKRFWLRRLVRSIREGQ